MQIIETASKLIPGRPYIRRRVKLICEDETLTKTSFTKDCDIKTIIAKAIKTGVWGDPNRTPIYGDFSNVNSDRFLDSLNLVATIKSQFEQLEPKIRERFMNDPAKLLEFIADENNNDEAIKLGLKEKPKNIDPPIKADPPPTADKITTVK